MKKSRPSSDGDTQSPKPECLRAFRTNSAAEGILKWFSLFVLQCQVGDHEHPYMLLFALLLPASKAVWDVFPKNCPLSLNLLV